MALSESAVEIGNDSVPEKYRGYFDNADWTLHTLVVQGSWAFVIVAAIAHFWIFTIHV
jgi:hypothetical protein